MIAPDETTFDYLQGPPARPAGRGLGRRRRVLAHAAHRRRRRLRRRGRHRRRPSSTPFVTWGTNPGQGAAAVGERARPGGVRRRQRRAGRRRARPGVHGPDRRHAAARHRGRHRLPRLLHQRPASRTCAPPPTSSAGPHKSPTACGCWSSPARRGCGSQAEAEGLDKVFTTAGAEWRVAGCSMCLGMNPDQLAPGRALRLHLQPQLRGPAGQGRPHAPGVAAGRRRHRRRAARSRLARRPAARRTSRRAAVLRS